tara:strand:- start:2875 stop:3213 length:339 start_codon:yes stop_codon:yes gene_type:complete
MRKNKKIISISSFKQSSNNKQIELPKQEIIKNDNIKTDIVNMKKINERELKYNKTEKKIIQINSKPTLKIFKELFNNSDDKIQFLTENSQKIKSLSKKQQRNFIDYIKNTYT